MGKNLSNLPKNGLKVHSEVDFRPFLGHFRDFFRHFRTLWDILKDENQSKICPKW